MLEERMRAMLLVDNRTAMHYTPGPEDRPGNNPQGTASGIMAEQKLNELARELLIGCKVGLRFTKNTATADAVSITKGDCDDAKTAVGCLQALIAKAEKVKQS